MPYSSNDTIFYTSELSLNTEYSISSNAITFNASIAENSVSLIASIAVFNVSLGINSEMYAANVSTNAIVLTNLNTYKPFDISSDVTIDTDTQIWIG
jgi:hypothetical protein